MKGILTRGYCNTVCGHTGEPGPGACQVEGYSDPLCPAVRHSESFNSQVLLCFDFFQSISSGNVMII